MRKVTVMLHGTSSGAELAECLTALLAETTPAYDLEVLNRSVLVELEDAGTVPTTIRDQLPLRSRGVDRLVSAVERFERWLETAPDSDVVMLKAGAVVGSGWLECLHDVAYRESVSASASAVASPALSGAADTGSVSGLVAPPDPVIESPAWGAVYVRRDALNLVWVSDDAFEDDVSLLGRLSVALSAPGLVNRLAYDVTVGVVGAPEAANLTDRDRNTPSVSRALEIRSRMNGPLSVMLDARCLDRPVSGTLVHIMSLAKALGESGQVELSLLVPRHVHESNQPYVDALGDTAHFMGPGAPLSRRPAIFHRPYQVSSEYELADCLGVGRRFVLTQQDMILDRTPSYFPSDEAWREFRRITAASLASADRVGFFSEHAASDAIADGTLSAHKASVIPLGVNHLDVSSDDSGDRMPGRFASIADTPFMVVIGHAYRHKNRLFALRLLDRLVDHHGWNGMLVLAGGDPDIGSSFPEETRYIEAHPLIGPRVIRVDHVTEREKRWLYRAARVVLFPSLYEGFGLIPFEAAAHGTPCVYGWRSSLREFLPEEGAILEGWDVAACSQRLLHVLEDVPTAEGLVAAVREAASVLTWARTAEGYVELYERALYEPVRFLVSGTSATGAGLAEFQVGFDDREVRIVDIYRRRRAFRATMDTSVRIGSSIARLVRSARRRST